MFPVESNLLYFFLCIVSVMINGALIEHIIGPRLRGHKWALILIDASLYAGMLAFFSPWQVALGIFALVLLLNLLPSRTITKFFEPRDPHEETDEAADILDRVAERLHNPTTKPSSSAGSSRQLSDQSTNSTNNASALLTDGTTMLLIGAVLQSSNEATPAPVEVQLFPVDPLVASPAEASGFSEAPTSTYTDTSSTLSYSDTSSSSYSDSSSYTDTSSSSSGGSFD